ncbi:MucBP domain-containing protein [Lactococcus lactis]|uniref:MucBP domain-containing protein n=1 Tax=Lactococcus lactis TaxID=1358 RepID=A0AAP4DU04_9LACT|nr:MucBP domain-containing protein [Lactococcus lactis]MDG4968258.1 MucBP domain-containing protein [Lactococcus lactis]MDG4976382.1 MucBP domain-containing protein [Lactococcus lactis]MDG5102186.1 MucBP domain-containing protein [Lactococcus lactis]
MTKYTKATLHANGETQEFATAEDAKRLRAAFKAAYFKSSDGTVEYGVTADASTFVVLTIDTTATPLAPKPNCDNYGDCADCPPSPVKGGDVTVKYVDEAAPTVDIAPGQVISGTVGDSYSTQQKTITGYTFKSVQGSKTGTITSTAQTVTYIYTKNP